MKNRGTASGGGAVFRGFLFEDTITTEPSTNYAEASYSPSSSNWLYWQPTAMDLVVNNVSYDNVVMEYNPDIGAPCFGAPYDGNSDTYDFSTYPFCLIFDYWNNSYYLYTETAGTYHVVATQLRKSYTIFALSISFPFSVLLYTTHSFTAAQSLIRASISSGNTFLPF